MQHRVDVFAVDFFDAAAEHPSHRRIDRGGHPVQIDSQDAVGGGAENQLVPPAEARQLLRLTLDRVALAEQLHEDRDLGPQHFRMKRLGHVVDRAELVSAENRSVTAADGREEDDRRAARFLALTNQGGSLEAVQAGHLHVEQYDGELLIEKRLQRRAAGVGLDQVLPHLAEDGLQGEKILRLVVDQQNVDLRYGRRCHA